MTSFLMLMICLFSTEDDITTRLLEIVQLNLALSKAKDGCNVVKFMVSSTIDVKNVFYVYF